MAAPMSTSMDFKEQLQFPIKRIVIHIKYRDTYRLWKKCIVTPLFSTKHAAFRSNIKNWLTLNQDKVEQHIYPQTVVSVIQHYKIKLSVLDQYKGNIISCNITCSCHNIAEKLHILALNNNHSLTNSNFVVYIYK